MPRPTIHDVAREVGVSPATVSRALARPHLVAAATVERVRATTERLGYAPSPQARWLHTGRTETFALVLPDITNPFFFDLIRGAQHEASAAGYTQVLLDTEESAADERSRLATARRTVDGAVLAGSRLTDDELVVLAADFPVVLTNRTVPGVSSVLIDSPRALAAAVAHLAGLGHRSIGYLGGPPSAWFDSRRLTALRRAARTRGVRAERLGADPPTFDAGFAATDHVLDRLRHGVTAVITYNDLQALGLLRGLTERGVDVPGELSLVGCDGIFGAELTTPQLTTVVGSAEQVGRLAVRALIDQLTAPESRDSVHAVVPASLRIRGSTGPAPTPPPSDPATRGESRR